MKKILETKNKEQNMLHYSTNTVIPNYIFPTSNLDILLTTIFKDKKKSKCINTGNQYVYLRLF